MPNALAYLMLLAWPVVAVALYQRLDPARALVWTILAAYMLLPPIAAFDLPAVPNFDKFSIPSLCALALTLAWTGERIALWPANPLARVFALAFVLTPFATSVTNPDPIPILSADDVPALSLYDSIAYVSGQAIALIPFLLARHLLGSDAGMRLLVQAMVAAGLAYSLPMLWESRMSPQLNIWVYGFFQHDFSQTIRGGGFRPVVFMPHGLWVAFFAVMAAVSALALLRDAGPEERPKRLAIWLYLMAVLYFCRSAGPTLYALGMTPLVLFAPRRVQLLVAGGLAAVVITYPLLRGAHLVPLDDILGLAERINPARAESLAFRIRNEELLLARAEDKPWFGWGGYGRNLILDPVSGRIQTIPDGGWIIVLGTYGWSGYLAQFGLLVMPLLLLAREALLRRRAELSLWGVTVALIFAANLVDLLPNNTLIPFTWLMAGALTGWAEALARDRRAAAVAAWKAGMPQGRRTIL